MSPPPAAAALEVMPGADRPTAIYRPNGVSRITYDTPQTVTLHVPGRNYIFAPLQPLTLGLVDAGAGPADDFVARTNYATVDTKMVIDARIADQYIVNENLQQHVLNSMLARVGQQLYGSVWNNQTTTATSDYAFNTVLLPDGTETSAIPFEIINYTTNATSVTSGINVTVQAHVTPEILEKMKVYQLNQQAAALMSQLRSKMRTVAIHVKKNKGRKHIPGDHQVHPQELKARETLREMITESEYRRYITNGFIMVKAKSGLWYQIFNKQAGYWVFSFKDGKMFERLCIHTDSICPPTDHVINMKVLAEIDEESLRKGANITKEFTKDPLYGNVIGDLRPQAALEKQESLLDVYRRLKVAKTA